MQIETYNKKYQQQVIELILNIQQNEFNVPVTIKDQPDLINIENFYYNKNGKFWIAIEGNKVIGTIALIDIDNKQSCLRKMFVHKDYRGKEKGTGQLLLDRLINWCKEKDIKEMAEVMSQKIGAQVVLSCKVDSSLIGGAIIQHGSYVSDYSLKSQLDLFRSRWHKAVAHTA